MKTKPFLLATAGATVDGRTIDEKMLEEMASSYDPKTYGARLNIEHIRGISGEGPFRAYGDVVELSIGETEVNFNGKREKRKALFGVLDVSDDAKKLNEAGQKLYPSIEVEPNFAGKGFAYLMGCALTDSPAAIATDRLQFNRRLPGALHMPGEEAIALEFADASETPAADSFLTKLGSVLDGFAAKFGGAAKPAPEPETKPEDAPPAAFDFGQMRPMFEEMGKAFASSIDGLRHEFRADADALALKIGALEKQAEATPASGFAARPPANGSGGAYAGIF